MRRLGFALLPAAVVLLAAAPATADVRHHSLRVDRPGLPHPFPQVIEGECPGAPDDAGCYIGTGDTLADGTAFARGAVFVYDRHDRFARAHELGHAFDDTMMDLRERNRFLRFTHQRSLYWTWYDEAFPNTPAEQFADAYANCRLRHEPGVTVWEAGYDYYPTAKQHRRICAMIKRADDDLGYPPLEEEVSPF